jgi:hypothetical protein
MFALQSQAAVRDKAAEATLAIGDCFTIKHVFEAIPRQSIDRALAGTDRSKRRDKRFPDYLVIYFVILMGLFNDLSYLHIFEKLRETLRWLCGDWNELTSLTNSAITQGRQRVGTRPLKLLFKLVARPMATAATPSAFFHGLHLVLIDGTNFSTEDTPANAEAFGRTANQHGASGFPQVRCVALIEWATRAVIDLVFGPYNGASEQSLSKTILMNLKPGMLCLADRLYPCFENCQMVIGADFVWRVKKDVKLKSYRRFKDGSYLAKLYGAGGKRAKAPSLTVRVIEYMVSGIGERLRLITSILEPKQAPAEELAKLYPKRWSQETFNSEIKNTLKSTRVVLRSKSPEAVEQELYGLFLAHYVIRSFMFTAAEYANIPPDILSFKHSVFVIKEQLPKVGAFSP